MPEDSSSPQGSPEGFARAAGDLRDLARLFENFLDARILGLIRERATTLVSDPVIYSLTAGGKRIRPALCMLCGGIDLSRPMDYSSDETLNEYAERLLFAGAALESIHTYSLIHDDLPPMDDDDLRRGRPSNHVRFGEWAAILAGDALNTLAFELMLRAVSPGESPARSIEILARGAGMGGMICGQALDLDAEKNERVKGGEVRDHRALLEEIHRKKTGALLRASCEIGGALAGCSDTTPYREYGAGLGLLFQISDDVLDETGDADTLGKTAGKDRESGKLTYPSLYGLEESKAKARDLCDELAALAENLEPGPHALADNRDVLRALPELIRDRKS